MKSIYLLFAFIGLFFNTAAQVKLRFELKTVPGSKDSVPEFFISGNFNAWNSKDTAFRFLKIPNGNYMLEKQLMPDRYEFKITRGSWAKVETDNKGNAIGNRILNLHKDTLVKIDILNWADNFEQATPKHTASPHVKVLDTAFFIPQLNTKRRVWIYLPVSYGLIPKKYPVLYMHDGQNLFDESTSSFGEWGIDELLDQLIANGGKEWIVVGIDHGGSERLMEYNPYNSKYGKGKGRAYVDFLVHSLKPYIDRHYRTFKGSKNTAIAGSSMGGLISMYAIAAYPHVFGKAGIFSPAFWLGKEIEAELKNAGNKLKKHQIYFVAGALEDKSMLSDMQIVYQILNPTRGNKSIKLIEKADGEHKEWFWNREFVDFYRFISN
ncbi:MAG: alpha/beta hydrolase-fold protein [Bacteroidota bacterium]